MPAAAAPPASTMAFFPYPVVVPFATCFHCTLVFATHLPSAPCTLARLIAPVSPHLPPFLDMPQLNAHLHPPPHGPLPPVSPLTRTAEDRMPV